MQKEELPVKMPPAAVGAGVALRNRSVGRARVHRRVGRGVRRRGAVHYLGLPVPLPPPTAKAEANSAAQKSDTTSSGSRLPTDVRDTAGKRQPVLKVNPTAASAKRDSGRRTHGGGPTQHRDGAQSTRGPKDRPSLRTCPRWALPPHMHDRTTAAAHQPGPRQMGSAVLLGRAWCTRRNDGGGGRGTERTKRLTRRTASGVAVGGRRRCAGVGKRRDGKRRRRAWRDRIQCRRSP